MRGSPYYIASLLCQYSFKEGAKKIDRINPNHPNYMKVASFNTMNTYKNVWHNFFFYLKEHWNIKDPEKITGEHIAAYMDHKASTVELCSAQYFQKISSALGKLEYALQQFTLQTYGEMNHYDFSIRQFILDEYRNHKLLADNYHNRTYSNPKLIISYLSDPLHRLAAQIQYESGGRLEGVTLIKSDQLQGIVFDPITQIDKGQIISKEKGGRTGPLNMSVEIYNHLKQHINEKDKFKIDRQKYASDIRNASTKAGEPSEGSHSFRWSFCKRRMMEYAKAGYTYEQSLQAVSWEMKHNRASITEHYL